MPLNGDVPSANTHVVSLTSATSGPQLVPSTSLASSAQARSSSTALPPLTQRPCETPSCDSIVPPGSRWQRCVQCSINRWRARCTRQASETVGVDNGDDAMAVDEEERLGAVTLHRVGVADAHTVAAADTGKSGPEAEGVEKPPALPPTSDVECSSPSSKSGRGLRHEPSMSSIPGWDSDLTDLSSDSGESEIESDSASEPSPRKTGLKIRLPVLASKAAQHGLRVCGIKRCNIVLPADHRWKICDPCRRHYREYQKNRLEQLRRRAAGLVSFPSPPMRSPSPEPTQKSSHAPGSPSTPLSDRLCVKTTCHAPLPPLSQYRWKCCESCRARARRAARRRKDALFGFPPSLPPTPPPDDAIQRYPTFQHLGTLLAAFKARLGRFMEAQVLYLRAKLQVAGGEALARLNPVLFAFDGEFATVTGQKELDIEGRWVDPQGRGGDMTELERDMKRQDEVMDVVRDLNGTLCTEFKSTEALAIKTGGIIMRFSCALEMIVPLRPLSLPLPDCAAAACDKPPEDAPQTPYTKGMTGELEVAVVPDNSHRLFIGQRTIIRFRMLG
ncbi:hypothetical protein BV22DRAFT_737704 [Leucogyrophana mollusca]|uniref:Uncharacterized protein n=1 Tax=Leucogyrophana mollusca TaxID=85980 RepID=A0ACB8B6L9_9AGAM|nr:hypothetical protein BV22DRAFT_737704 [Leucogyrophana mollusca]